MTKTERHPGQLMVDAMRLASARRRRSHLAGHSAGLKNDFANAQPRAGDLQEVTENRAACSLDVWLAGILDR